MARAHSRHHAHSHAHTAGYSAAEIKAAASARGAGAILDLLEQVAGVPRSILDDRSTREHPCPKCGGSTRCRLIDPDAGAVRCSHCCKDRCGDFLAAIVHFRGVSFPEAVRLAAEHLGLPPRGPASRDRQAGGQQPQTGRPGGSGAAAATGAASPPGAGAAKTIGLPPGQVERTYPSLVDAYHVYSRSPRLGPAHHRWIYHDAAGRIVEVVLRWNIPEQDNSGRAKTYRPISRVQETRWRLKHLDRAEQPLYRLPEILASATPAGPASAIETPTIYVTEGEKTADAVRAIGLTATCCLGGSGAPTDHPAWRTLAGRSVVLLPDNDPPGEKFAADIAAALAKLTPPARVKIVKLPGLGQKEDAYDWIAARGAAAPGIVPPTADDASQEGAAPASEPPPLPTALAESIRGELLAAVAATPNWTPTPPLPTVLDGLDEHRVAEEVLGHLAELGFRGRPDEKRRHRVFQRGGVLVHVIEDRTKAGAGVKLPANMLRIRPLPEPILRERVSQSCRILSSSPPHDPIRPPAHLVDALFHRGEYSRVRSLHAVVRSPTLRPDGSVLQVEGHDPATGLLYIPDREFPPIPEAPTQAQAAAALDDLAEVVCDFPFAGPEHLSVWLALVLSLVGRPAIEKTCPLFAVDANTRGTGKTLLAALAAVIATGSSVPVRTMPREDDELRKVITTVAMEALPVILLDNVDRQFGTPELDAALTRDTWSDRVLGASKSTGDLPLKAVWIATGNNLALGADIARRVMLCRLETDLETPENRTGFKHPNIEQWSADHRARLVADALTALRGFIAAGRPGAQQLEVLGSFEPWSELVRGAIVWCGRPDPYQTRTEVRKRDRSHEALEAVILGLEEIPTIEKGVTNAEIEAMINQVVGFGMPDPFPRLRSVVGEICGGKFSSQKLGNRFGKLVGWNFRGRKILRSRSNGITTWSLAYSAHGHHSQAADNQASAPVAPRAPISTLTENSEENKNNNTQHNNTPHDIFSFSDAPTPGPPQGARGATGALSRSQDPVPCHQCGSLLAWLDRRLKILRCAVCEDVPKPPNRAWVAGYEQVVSGRWCTWEGPWPEQLGAASPPHGRETEFL